VQVRVVVPVLRRVGDAVRIDMAASIESGTTPSGKRNL